VTSFNSRDFDLHVRTLFPVAVVVAFMQTLAGQESTPNVRIVLPERPRFLQKQLVDLVIEVRNAAMVGNVKVTVGDADWTGRFRAPVRAELDCDTSSDWVIRADLQSFDTPGDVRLQVSASAGGRDVSDSRTIGVQEFTGLLGQRLQCDFVHWRRNGYRLSRCGASGIPFDCG
jgi:hypothetical protein